MARLVPRKETDRSFDLEFWQAQTTEARWAAGWELVLLQLEKEGRLHEQRLQRTVERLCKLKDKNR